MSDTPRTDAVAFLFTHSNASLALIFCMSLERKLAAVIAERNHAKEAAFEFEQELVLARSQRDQSHAALVKYGAHPSECGVWNDEDSLCTCGFTAALEACKLKCYQEGDE